MLTDEILKARNNNLNVCTAFLDLTKAFNCVDHSIIIKKLQHYSIDGSCLRWFASYLDKRTQFTFMGNHSSEKEFVPCRVPQGSVLGPILYLIYVNDIGTCNINSKVIMFADDSVLFSLHQDPHIATDNLRNDLEIVRDYFLSLKKTTIMNFSRFWHDSNRITFPEITSDNVVIEQFRFFKYLGVIIDLGAVVYSLNGVPVLSYVVI